MLHTTVEVVHIDRILIIHHQVARWPSGLRRWIQAKASTRTLEIPILPECVGSNPTLVIQFFFVFYFLFEVHTILMNTKLVQFFLFYPMEWIDRILLTVCRIASTAAASHYCIH